MTIPYGAHFVFIGDSITHGLRNDKELNPAFKLGAGFVNHIASKLWLENPGAVLVFTNRGICGNTVLELGARWEADALSLSPDVLTVLIGVNDNNQRHLKPGKPSTSPTEYGVVLEKLLCRARQHNPSMLIVVVEPFLLSSVALVGQKLEAALEEMTARGQEARRCCEQCGGVFVPMQSAFADACLQAPPEFWSYDGIHPTAAGFALITQEWFKAVAPNVEHASEDNVYA